MLVRIWGGRRALLHYWEECKLVLHYGSSSKNKKENYFMILLYNCWAYRVCKSTYKRDACTPMFIIALVTIVKLWKHPRNPTIDGWIKKIWYICTMEYYSAIRKNKIMSYVRKQMELESIMLSDISHAPKAKYFHVFTHMWNVQND
jgi:hypothetical protein